ncbi:hypothetical protein KM803_09240 [Clostridium tyrobutyricum]|uniref:ImmA/IrrE family metallo-endopeptidase n=1 Tax=Clostridium tyrobutyricum TaxID=1519 RepID=UPI001C38FAA8|nr:ImmA/IrrE family metallo-endopeptidase [Clostridium tyrobutyricum]MBV4431518.1 hypothetical protein [Clostridium tyrobutyricum]
MTYDKLVEEAELEDIQIIEINLGRYKGLYSDNTIALSKNIETNTEKACVLAEELGHHYKTCGEIVDNKNINKIKQEKLARRWGYEKLVGIVNLINAFNSGLRGKYEISQFLGVTEGFLEESIEYYKQKYGTYFEIDSYVIYFEPYLGIMKKF